MGNADEAQRHKAFFRLIKAQTQRIEIAVQSLRIYLLLLCVNAQDLVRLKQVDRIPCKSGDGGRPRVRKPGDQRLHFFRNGCGANDELWLRAGGIDLDFNLHAALLRGTPFPSRMFAV